jgi:hypothetical protein
MVQRNRSASGKAVQVNRWGWHHDSMRIEIQLEDELVAAIDARVGTAGREDFVADAVRTALGESWRWDQLESAIGSIEDGGHDWDPDPGAWTRQQRFS